MSLNMAHLVKLVSKLLCLFSLAITALSLTHFEEIKEVRFHGQSRHRQFAQKSSDLRYIWSLGGVLVQTAARHFPQRVR